MSRSPTKTTASSDCPEFAVTREAFNRYFEKPLPTSIELMTVKSEEA